MMKRHLRSSTLDTRSSAARAFTLIELLVVIGIIVLVVLISIPVLNVLQGNRSIDTAQNQVQALLNEARMMAIGVQRDTGVMFYIEPSTQRVHTVLVQATDFQPGDPDVEVMLDLVPDHESVPFTVGLSAQMIDNSLVAGAPPVRGNDGYIGYNILPIGSIQYGGVILFDLHGQLVSRTYGFRLQYPLAGGGFETTEMAKLLLLAGPPGPGFAPPPPFPESKFGLVIFNTEMFLNQDFNHEDSQVAGVGYTAGWPSGRTEQDEETWIDQNSVPFMVNRYNGTLIRGE